MATGSSPSTILWGIRSIGILLLALPVAGSNDILFSLGGHDGKSFSASMELYDDRQTSWRGVSDMMDYRGHFGTAVVNNKIWVTGGWDPYTKSRMQREKTQEKALFSTEIYQPLQDTWKTGPDMPERRAFHQCVSIGGSIYVLGGFDGVRDLDSVCKLDTSTGRWSYDVPMRIPRSGFAAGVVRGRILVMGGHNGLECLGSCESIDPREGKWRSEPELLYHRAYAGSCYSGDCIFVAGGNFGKVVLNTVEMFDARKSVWRSLPSMNVKRNGLGLGLVGDSLFAAGGFEGSHEILSLVEKLDMSNDLSTEKWQLMPEMSNRRDGCALAVVPRGMVQPSRRGSGVSDGHETRGTSANQASKSKTLNPKP